MVLIKTYANRNGSISRHSIRVGHASERDMGGFRKEAAARFCGAVSAPKNRIIKSYAKYMKAIIAMLVAIVVAKFIGVWVILVAAIGIFGYGAYLKKHEKLNGQDMPLLKNHKMGGAVDVPGEVSSVAQPDHVGFLNKLRAGDFGLFETYWFFGVFVGVVANIFGSFITSDLGSGVFGIAYSLYGSQVAIGLWRSAGKYKGLKALAVISRIVAVLSFLAIVILVLLSAFDLLSWVSSFGSETLEYRAH